MRRLIALCLAGVALAGIVSGVPQGDTASAATRINYLRWCTDTVTTRCVDSTDDGLIHYRSQTGRIHVIGDETLTMSERRTLILRWAARSSRPCAYEGQNRCYWDATRQGNGIGSSYVVIARTVYYIDPVD